MINKTFKVVAASAVVATAFSFAGCSKSEDSAAASTKAKKAEQILRRGNGAEPSSLDPQLSSGVPAGNLKRDLFEGLVSVDPAGKIVPGVAESWTISEDGKTYTFNLRKSNWSNGNALTAHDFVAAWQRGVNPETAATSTFMLYPVLNAEEIVKGKEKDVSKLGVKAVDDYTFEVTLKSPAHYFLSVLNHPITFPLPKDLLAEFGKEWYKKSNYVSNGAFTITAWTPQASIELTKSATYWDKDSVKLDKVMYYPTEDTASEFKRFRAGELDFTYNVPSDQASTIKADYPDEYHTYNKLGTHYYGFNTKIAPFKDNLALRKALSYAIDRNVLTEKVLKQGNKVAYGVVVPTVNNVKPYVPAFAKMTQEERNAKAKELYKEAGYSAEKPLKLELVYNTNEAHKKVAIAITAMWKETLGVDVDLYNKEWKVYLSTRGDSQAFRAGWIGDYSDPNTFLDIWLPEGKINNIGFKSEKFNKLMKQSTLEQDLVKRADILHDAEKEVIDSFSVVPLYYFVNKRLVSKRVKGFEHNVMGHHLSKHMYFAD